MINLHLSGTCVRMLVHCWSSETGGWPRLVASWTRSSCSFCVELSTIAWSSATAANHVDRPSELKRPEHSNWPADTELADVDKHTQHLYQLNRILEIAATSCSWDRQWEEMMTASANRYYSGNCKNKTEM